HTFVIQSTESEYEYPLEIAYDFILGFSDKGKPLTLDGPVHVYLGDGSNQQSPIKNIKSFIIK
ncbi:MAG: peptidyl-prolyl cis-trans isomerase, partial [Bacillus sp. (in: firmicutes)]